MNFNYNLLSVAIAASLLTACGGSSKSSAPQIAPLPDPTPVVLTDEQKQALGKTFIAGMSQQVSTLSTQSAGLIKDILNATNDADSEAGSHQVKQGLAVVSKMIAPVKNQIRMAYQKLKSEGDGVLGQDIPLYYLHEGFNQQGEKTTIKLQGSVVLTRATNGALSYTFDAIYTQALDGASSFASDLQLVVTEVALPYSPTIEADPADSDYQLSISGTLSNDDMDMVLTGASLSAIYVEDESKNNAGAIKQAALNISKLTVTTSELTVSAEVDALLEQPLQKQADDYFYSGIATNTYSPTTPESTPTAITIGSLAVMATHETAARIGPFNTALPFAGVASLIGNNTPIAREAERSLNIGHISLKNLKVELLDSGDYLSLEDVTFTTHDALYRDDLYSYGGLAGYEYNQEHTQLVIENVLGTATYSFEPSNPEDSSSAGHVTCIRDTEAYIVEPYIGFAPGYGGCTEGFKWSANDLDSFVNSQNYPAGTAVLATPYGRHYSLTNVTFVETDNNKGVLRPSSPVRPSPDSLSAPVDYSLMAKGLLAADGINTPFSIQLQHPSAFDYQLTSTFGQAPTAMVATWGTLDPNFELNTQVDFSGQNLSASLNFDMASIEQQMQVFREDQELEQAEAAANGYLTIIAGNLVVDNLTVANIYLHVDPSRDDTGIITENNPFSSVEGLSLPSVSSLAVSMKFLDGSAPSGALFADVAQFSKTQKIVDCPAPESEVEKNAEQPVCTEDVMHALNGIVDLKSLSEAFVGELEPYNFSR